LRILESAAAADDAAAGREMQRLGARAAAIGGVRRLVDDADMAGLDELAGGRRALERVRIGDDAGDRRQLAAQDPERARDEPALGVRGDLVEEDQAAELDAGAGARSGK
jgi:hypothetical protein